MTETRKAVRMKGAAMDVLASIARVKAGSEADDVQIMCEAAGDMHIYALELSFADGAEVAA